MRLALRLLFATIISTLVGACGEPYSSPTAHDRHWHEDPRPRGRPWGLTLREWGPIELPEARHARSDWGTPFKNVIVNVLADGDLLLKGRRLKFASGNEDEVVRAAGFLGDMVRSARIRSEDPQVGIALFADRSTRWVHVSRAAITALAAVGDGARRLEWYVWRPPVPRFHDLVQVATVRAIGGESVAPDAVRVVLTRPANTVGLAIDRRTWSWTVPESEPFSDAAFLTHVNGIWKEVEAHLSALGTGRTSATLRTEDDTRRLSWAVVAKVLDLLYGAGLTDVWLPDLGLRLELGAPAPETLAHDPLSDRPLLTPLIVVACFLAVLAAFAVTLWPLRRKARVEAS